MPPWVTNSRSLTLHDSVRSCSPLAGPIARFQVCAQVSRAADGGWRSKLCHAIEC